MRYLLAMMTLALLIGCGKKHEIVGFWQPGTTPAIYEFRSDGEIWISQGPFSVRAGKYVLNANELEVTLSGLDPTRPSMTIKSAIEWQDADHFRVASSNEFGHSPLGSEPFHRLTAAERENLGKEFASKYSGIQGIPGQADLEQFRTTPESTQCLANVKQLSLAAMLYSQDYDGALPGSGNWNDQIMPYVRAPMMLTCPAVAKAQQSGGYSLNSEIAAMRAGEIRSPETVPMIFETTDLQPGSIQPFTSFLPTPRHGETRSVAYADGHAKGLKVGEKG